MKLIDCKNRNIKKLISVLAFLFILSIFFVAASIEKSRAIQDQQQNMKDNLLSVKIKLENIISSRMTSVNGLIAYSEIKPDFTQEDYNHFAKEIYRSDNQIVKSMSFLSDTTITHIYPYQENRSAIGYDLAKVDGQMDLVLYAKKYGKSVFIAPVNLVEGGTGIIARVPVSRDGNYLGQVSIVFDYNKVIKHSGIQSLGKSNYIVLSMADPSTKEEKIIWSNSNGSPEKGVREEISIYDSNLTIVGMPKAGWNGDTNLFYTLISLGFFFGIIASIAAYKLMSFTAELEQSHEISKELNVRLVQTNNELEATINQLKASEELLKSQNNELRMQEEYIQFLAYHDPLTELYNRRKFKDDLEKRLEENEAGILILLDIDNFKNINDTKGHIYGDKVLSHTAGLLKKLPDTNVKTYRFGGDEFLVLIEGDTGKQGLELLMDKIYRQFEKAHTIDGLNNYIHASAGVVKYPADGETVEALLIKADVALYQAKDSGRNQFMVFDHSMLCKFEEKINIENILRKNLEEKSFHILYQPIVDMKSGQINSFEALLRVQDNVYNPSTFIPIAEETGLILPIGKLVVKNIIRQIKQWVDQGLHVKPVAINFSAKQFTDLNHIDFLIEEMQKNDIGPELIEIEITESLLLDNTSNTTNIINRLKQLGIRVVLDDFGTGYSSLVYLTYMSVDRIKIDKKLKDKLLINNHDDVMKNIISLAHSLDLEIVTEGIEEKHEFEVLRDAGSDYVQGYYFSKPITPQNAEQLMATDRWSYFDHIS